MADITSINLNILTLLIGQFRTVLKKLIILQELALDFKKSSFTGFPVDQGDFCSRH